MNLTDVLNIQSSETKTVSLVTFLVLFYILITTNASENLISKQLREMIENNRYIQHILGFMTLFVLITLVVDTIDIREAIAYSALGYIFFIFTTKLDAHWNIIILILLFISYAIEHGLNMRAKYITDDKNLTNERKKELMDEIKLYKSWMVGLIIVVTILGTIFYSHKKYEQYGGGYDIFVYFFGRN